MAWGNTVNTLNHTAKDCNFCVADITKKALGMLPQRLADAGAKIIGTVHVDIILEVPEKKAGEFAVILKETMIQAGKAYLSGVPVEVEVTIGGTWAEK
ncbi:MAG: DNA polymerase [Syntrophobacteraceae bacterium]|jgi:DNA polymerase-1